MNEKIDLRTPGQRRRAKVYEKMVQRYKVLRDSDSAASNHAICVQVGEEFERSDVWVREICRRYGLEV